MGTSIISKIVPQNNAPFETHEDSLGKGGYTTFATLALRDAQVAARLKVGMRCFVSETGLDYRLVDLTPTWVVIAAATSPNAVLQVPVGGPPFSAPITEDQVLSAYNCTLSGSATLDLGASSVTPAFTATYVRTPTTAVLTDDQGSPSKDVHTTPGAFNSNGTFTKSVFGQSATFTLTASDSGAIPKTSSVTISWYNRAYFGVGAAGQTGATFILSLGSNHLQSARPDAFTVTASGANKIYYATRSAFGLCTFTVGGFTGGFTQTQTAVPVTNAFGVVENYDLYESDGIGLGLTNVGVNVTVIPFTGAVTTTANFTQPTVGGSANASVTASSSFVTGEPVFLAGAGQLQVASIVDGLTVSLTNLGYTGNSAPATVISPGAGITPSGVIGPTGNAYTVTTASFTMPGVLLTSSATVGSTAWMSVGQNVYLVGAGYLSVSSIIDSTHVLLANTGAQSNAAVGTLIASPAGLSPAGAAGPNAFIFVRPIDGVSDDWPTLMAVLTANAYGKPVMMLPGLSGQSWQCKSKLVTPSGSTIYGTSGTRIVCTLPTAFADFTSSAFNGAGVPSGTLNLLTSNNVPGTNQIAVTSTVSVGALIILQVASGLHAAGYTVTAVSGTGPYTLTLDRIVQFGFTVSNGDGVIVQTSRPQDIRIFGNGMTITGVAKCYLNFDMGYRCHIEGVTFDSTGGALVAGGGAYPMRLGPGTVDCKIVRLRMTNVTAPNPGIQLASCESVQVVDCTLANTNGGIQVYDNALTEILNCNATNTGFGVQISSWDASGLAGCQSCKVIGGSYTNMTAQGLRALAKSFDTLFMGVSLRQCVTGIQVDATSGASKDTGIVACEISGGTNGISAGGVIGTTITGCHIDDPTGVGIVISGGDTCISNLKCRISTSNTQGILIQVASSIVNLVGFTFEGLAAATGNFFIYLTAAATGAVANISNGTFTIIGAASSTAVYVAGGVANLSHVKTLGTSAGVTGANGVSPGLVRVGYGVNFASAGTPFNVGGAALNFGTLTANGTTAVVIPFTDLRSSDTVVLTRVTGGLGTSVPVATRTNGTGFSFASYAGDTGTYNWRIDG